MTKLNMPLLSPREVAELFGVSERKWRGMDCAGQVPMPIRLGEQPRWCVAELRAWAAAGAPSRVAWESMKPEQAGGGR